MDVLSQIQSGKLTGTVEDIIFWTLGMQEFDSKSYEEAIKFWEKINLYSSREEYASIYAVIGLNYFKLRLNEQALKYLNLALILKPNDGSAYNNRGLAYFAIGNYDKA